MASIRKHRDKWQARIKRGAIVTEKSFLNKRDAERWARQIEADIERGEYHPPQPNHPKKVEVTLHDLLDRYDREVAPKHRSESSHFNIRVLKRTMADTILSKFDAQAVARWRDERLKSVKPPTVARQLNTLSAILNHARKEWCYSIANPIRDIKRPAQSQSRTRRLEAEEEYRILAAMEPHYARVVRFALSTAMRRGEVLSLTWKNVDMTSRVPVVQSARSSPFSSGWKQQRDQRLIWL
jgi:integrase